MTGDLPEGQQSKGSSRRPPLVGPLDVEEDAPSLPSMGRVTGKVKIFTEDGWAAEVARVRADVAEEIAQAIEARRAGPGWGIWAQSMNSAAQVAREHAVAPAESVVAPTQPAGTREQVGRCGDAMPSLVDLRPRYFCSLPAGHLGWHRCDEGAEWTHGAPVGALPEDEGTRQERLINGD